MSPLFPNTSPTLFALVGEGNHKLSGSNKGSGDPFVENDRQTGTFSGNHQPRARQVRGGEVSRRKELDTRVSSDSHTKEYFLGLYPMIRLFSASDSQDRSRMPC